jgi:hypothetical protein
LENGWELYAEKLWEVSDKVKLLNSDVKIISKEFPFNIEINANYIVENAIIEQDELYEISFKNWFKHIYYKDMNFDSRSLDYYVDFLGKDSYSIMIQFDNDIKLIDPLQEVNINNEFGIFQADVSQVQTNAIRISTNYVLLKEKIEAKNINMVKDIFNAITDINNLKIKFEII